MRSKSFGSSLRVRLGALPKEAYERYLDEVAELSTSQKVKLRQQMSAAKVFLKGHIAKRDELSIALARAKSAKVKII